MTSALRGGGQSLTKGCVDMVQTWGRGLKIPKLKPDVICTLHCHKEDKWTRLRDEFR